MSIWGKVGGAGAGFLMGGPIGALVGAVAGHFIFDREADPGIVFTIAVIALAGKMAKADGAVSDAELDAFARVFRVPPQEEANVRRIFNLARQDVAGYESYAQQIARLYVGNPAVLEDVLDGLFEIAKSDGVLHPAEAAFLERVADIFGFAPNEYRRIRASPFRAGTDRSLCDPGRLLCRRARGDQTDLSPSGAREPSRQPHGPRRARRIRQTGQ